MLTLLSTRHTLLTRLIKSGIILARFFSYSQAYKSRADAEKNSSYEGRGSKKMLCVVHSRIIHSIYFVLDYE